MRDWVVRALPNGIELHKINDIQLALADKTFDFVFAVTVFQHNTDEQTLKGIVAELARVSAYKVYLFERIERTIMGTEL